MKKTILIIVVIILALVIWQMMGDDGAQNTELPNPEQDDSSSIEAELEGLDETDLEAEFQEYDQESEELER